MKLLDYIFRIRGLSGKQIEQEHLGGMLYHFNSCRSDPSKVMERYETLKEIFPAIVRHSEVKTPQFIDYVRLLYREMGRKGDWQEGIDFLKLALNTRQAEEDLLESYLWMTLFDSYIPDYESAIACAYKGIELAQRLKDDLSLMTSKQYLARVYRSQGNYASAIRHYNEIIQMARRYDNEERIAHAHGSKGLTLWHLKEYENALLSLQIARDIFFKLNNEERTGHALNNAGLVYTDLGLYREAQLHFEKAADIARKLTNEKEFALIEGNIGMVYFYVHEYDKALAYLKRTMRTMDVLQSNYRLAKAKIQLALVYQHLPPDIGSPEVALQYAKESYDIGLQRHIIHFEIMGASYQALLLKRLGRLAEAVSLSWRAVEVLEQVQVFDGSEEEIYFNHYLTLKDVDATMAVAYLKRARQEMQAKAENISDSNFKQSFLRIGLHQKILRACEETLTEARHRESGACVHDLAARRAAIVGTGGAAAEGLAIAGAQVTLVNSSLDKGERAAGLLKLPFVPPQ